MDCTNRRNWTPPVRRVSTTPVPTSRAIIQLPQIQSRATETKLSTLCKNWSIRPSRPPGRPAGAVGAILRRGCAE